MKQYIVPVLIAMFVMILIFMTVPLTSKSASVQGGYGGYWNQTD